MYKVTAEITFINEDDISYEAKKLPITEIQSFMIKDRKILEKSQILILKTSTGIKLLKSKY